MIELIVGTNRIDLRPGEQIILQDSIGRIGDFSEREGQVTNDFQIVWTAQNIAALGFHDKTTATSDFPYQKQDAVLRQRGTEISRGFIQLVKVDQRARTATLSFFGTNTNPFFTIGSDTLRDLDFSALNHTWDEANISASWTNTEGYIYPLVDPNKWESIGALSPGTAVTEWFPAVYQHTIVQKIFDRIGYKLAGDWLDSFAYKNAIVPVVRMVSSSTVNTFSSAEATQNQVIQYIPTTISGAGGSTSSKLSFQVTNDSTHFDAVNNNYTATTTTTEQLDFSATFNILTWNVNAPNPGTPITITSYARIYKNGSLVSSDQLHQSTTAGFSPSTPINWTSSQSIAVVATDTVYVNLEIEYTGASGTVTGLQVIYNVQDYKIAAPNLVQDASLSAGDEIDIAYNLPDLSQRDFLRDMIVRHALLVTTDNYTQTVTFTPAEKVFRNTLDALDWTAKVNPLQTSLVDFVEVVQDYGQRTNFSYAQDDNDTIMTAWREAQGTNYGDGAASIANEFLASEVDFYTSIFAGTTHRKVFTSDPVLDRPFIPVIPFYDADGNIQEVAPRLLYVIPDTSVQTLGGGTSIKVGASNYNDVAYSYFSRNKLNNALDVYIDGLAWDLPNISNPADISLLTRWYRQIVRVWNAPRYIETQVRLFEYEYQTLDFLNPVYIDIQNISGYYIIDEIESYDGLQATVKLIQIE